MRARFFPVYSENEVSDREYSITGHHHVDPGNWDFRKLLYWSDSLARDLKEEKRQLEALANK